MASELKTEKNPIRCDGLYTVASSKRIRFWSGLPPLTKKPLEPSPVLLIPGSNCIVFNISCSPKMIGMVLTSDGVIRDTPIPVDLTFSSVFVPVTTISSVLTDTCFNSTTIFSF